MWSQRPSRKWPLKPMAYETMKAKLAVAKHKVSNPEAKSTPLMTNKVFSEEVNGR